MAAVSLDMRTTLCAGSLAGLWWLLSDGDPASWVVGLPAVAAAVWSTRRLRSEGSSPVSVTGLLLFIPFFLWESLRGGIDVTRRTPVPKMLIQPGFAEFRTRLQRPDARVFLVNCMSLLPGTLAANLQGERLTVHLIDVDMDVGKELRRLEHGVARVFPEPIDWGTSRSWRNRIRC